MLFTFTCLIWLDLIEVRSENYIFFLPVIKDIRKRIIKITKIILAIPAAVPAIPPNPKTPAINAIIIKVIVQRNIILNILNERLFVLKMPNDLHLIKYFVINYLQYKSISILTLFWLHII